MEVSQCFTVVESLKVIESTQVSLESVLYVGITVIWYETQEKNNGNSPLLVFVVFKPSRHVITTVAAATHLLLN